MPVVVIANPKGGVGKSTLSTNVAGYLASRGHAVMLGDADRQQSSALWLSLRPAAARPIRSWEVSGDHVGKPPKGTTRPGGSHAGPVSLPVAAPWRPTVAAGCCTPPGWQGSAQGCRRAGSNESSFASPDVGGWAAG